MGRGITENNGCAGGHGSESVPSCQSVLQDFDSSGKRSYITIQEGWYELMHKTITVELDRELWELFRPFYQHPQEAMKEVAVLELYRRREISSGKAAELLGMERFEFIRHASRLGIPYFDMDEVELADEVRQALKPG